jgi:hypothetical protein
MHEPVTKTLDRFGDPADLGGIQSHSDDVHEILIL